jgi:hypothetical protein
VSFGTYARQVRDPALPFARRVSALRSCVQRYRPIGFQNSLSFLEEIARPYQSDEAALLRALDALVASRAQWQVLTEAYAQMRRAAKRHGQRSPGPGDLNPDQPDRWHGDARHAALHVMRKEQAELGRLAPAIGPDSAEAALTELLDASIAAQGQLSPDRYAALSTLTESLHARLTRDLYREDPVAYFYVRRLLRLAKLMDTAALDSDSPSPLR